MWGRFWNVRTAEDVVAEMKDYIERYRATNFDFYDLTAIVMKTLEKDPKNRFQSAKELGDALEYYMYHDRYGPTNEKLAEYVRQIFPDADPDRIE